MRIGAKHDGFSLMASPWRRRRMCVLVAGSPFPAALREVSGAGALLETVARLPLGATVELRHPDAGAIGGTIDAVTGAGLSLRFDRSERSVAFALAAITADMSRSA